MAIRTEDTVEITLPVLITPEDERFTPSEDQLIFLGNLLHEQGLTQEQVVARYPKLQGWQVLQALASKVREGQRQATADENPSDRQRELLKAYEVQAEEIGEMEVLESIRRFRKTHLMASRGDFSRILSSLAEIITLPTKEEKTGAIDALAAAKNAAAQADADAEKAGFATS